MTTESVTCKNCHSDKVKKYGIQHGTQMYYCHTCKRKFKNDDSLYGGRVSASDVSSALMEYYSGMSVNDIRNRINQEKGYQPAQSTIARKPEAVKLSRQEAYARGAETIRLRETMPNFNPPIPKEIRRQMSGGMPRGLR